MLLAKLRAGTLPLSGQASVCATEGRPFPHIQLSKSGSTLVKREGCIFANTLTLADGGIRVYWPFVQPQCRWLAPVLSAGSGCLRGRGPVAGRNGAGIPAASRSGGSVSERSTRPGNWGALKILGHLAEKYVHCLRRLYSCAGASNPRRISLWDEYPAMTHSSRL